jgi:hypothetical protein
MVVAAVVVWGAMLLAADFLAKRKLQPHFLGLMSAGAVLMIVVDKVFA